MTGIIELWDRSGLSGLINAQDGTRVRFESAALLAYDAGHIAAGQSVSFDLKPGRLREAVNVCVVKPAPLSLETKAVSSTVHTRYTGFDHRGNVRCYRFECTGPGREVRTTIFQVDLQLLREHSISIQDGPALCNDALSRLKAPDPGAPDANVVLGQRDLAAYRAAHPLAVSKTKFPPRRAVVATA